MSSKLRRLSVVILLLMCLMPLARADEASKRAKLSQIFLLMKMDALVKQMMQVGMQQGEEGARTLFGEKPLSAEDQKILESFKAKFSALLSDTLSWEKLQSAYLDLYAATYSEEDVDGMLAFYKSAAGQDMVTKTPELINASQKIVVSRMQSVQPKLQSLMQDLQKQVAAAHPQAKPAN